MKSQADFLTDILAKKRERVEQAKLVRPLKALLNEAEAAREDKDTFAFQSALADKNRINIIAEIKRASPSKGALNLNLSPENYAKIYQENGAAAISVLTEEDFFAGSLADLQKVRAAVSIPVLRKDFIFNEYQIVETAASGTDALLLIVAALDDEKLLHLLHLTENFGMDALVEVHDEGELERALNAGAKIIGVNNRNLRTFETSLETSVKLAKSAATKAILISESGLKTSEDLRNLQNIGYSGFLIGETIVRAENPAQTLKVLCGEDTENGAS